MTDAEAVPVDDAPAGEILDALVAERILRWRVHPANTAHWMRAGGDPVDYRVMGWTAGTDRFAPSARIQDAMQAAEALSGRFRLTLTGPYLRAGKPLWLASLYPQERSPGSPPLGKRRNVRAEADAPSLAVARVLLKAAGVREVPREGPPR